MAVFRNDVTANQVHEKRAHAIRNYQYEASPQLKLNYSMTDNKVYLSGISPGQLSTLRQLISPPRKRIFGGAFGQLFLCQMCSLAFICLVGCSIRKCPGSPAICS